MVYYIVWQVLRVLVIVFFRIRTYGKRNMPVKGGALLASNHQSYLDPALIALALNKPIYFLARKELFKANWVFGWLITQLHSIPLDRKGADSTGLRRAIEVLRNGGLLVVFPEGTRTPDGRIGEIKKGVTLLGMRANVPLIPTLVDGAYKSWPRKSKLPVRFAPVTVRFGQPVWLDNYGQSPDGPDISVIPERWNQLAKSKNIY